MKNSTPESIDLALYARRNYNYLTRLVDAAGIPYFDVFWADPPRAAHDWPDWGDVMARQYQAAVMGRIMTGEPCAIEKTWRGNLLGLIEDDGLLYRPETSFSRHEADNGDQALTFYALAFAACESQDRKLIAATRKMARALLQRFKHDKKPTQQGFIGPFAIKGLMLAARRLNSREALEVAGLLATRTMDDPAFFAPDNHFRQGGHMHGNLRSLQGIADYALYAKDPVMYSRVDAIYNYVVRETTMPFGFILEGVPRRDDIVLCETCTLMDYVGLGVTLANHGHPEYWDNVERIVRNQLTENQYPEGACWLGNDDATPDNQLETFRELDSRLAGAYAGWSSPTHFLGARETLDAHWGGNSPHLGGKTRAFQHCCGGSGTHAFYIAWSNAAEFSAGTLSVHLHFDKLLPEAEIRCEQPWNGVTRITLKRKAALRLRLPDFVPADGWKLKKDGRKLACQKYGNYLYVDEQPRGAVIELSYPLDEYVTTESIGNPGHRQYRYRVTWRGSTVVEVKPLGRQYKKGYSAVEKGLIETFYGEEGPWRLYRREGLRRTLAPAPAKLQLDKGELNLWRNLA